MPFALLLAATLALIWYSTQHLARTEAAQPVAFAFGGEARPVDYARAMADGARAALGTDVGVGITGVAGPGGGTPDKPVGLVHLCVTSADRVLPLEVRLGGDRQAVRERTVVVALHLLRELLASPA